MKETVGAIICVTAIALMCLGDKSVSPHDMPAAEETITPQISETVSSEPIHTSESTFPKETSNEPYVQSSQKENAFDIQSLLPDSLYWDAENEAIKYVTPDTSIRVYFPDIFCYVQEDRPSEDGICLATKDGKAALMIGTMPVWNVTPMNLVEYLKNQYTDSTVYLTDNKDVVCIYDTTDNEGTEWTYFLRVRICENDYFEIAVMCPTNQKSRYSNIFSRIELTNLQF